MRKYTQKSESTSRALESTPRASRQAPISDVLQTYKGSVLGKKTIQSDTAQCAPNFNVIQKDDDEYFGDNYTRLKKKDLEEASIDIPSEVESGLDYSNNKIINETSVFNLASTSGVLLKREGSIYHVHSVQRKTKQEIYTSSAVISQVLTTGISSCSFIVMTDAERSFVMVAHLDRTDQINSLIARMSELKLIPTYLFASIINGIEEKNVLRNIKMISRFKI